LVRSEAKARPKSEANHQDWASSTHRLCREMKAHLNTRALARISKSQTHEPVVDTSWGARLRSCSKKRDSWCQIRGVENAGECFRGYSYNSAPGEETKGIKAICLQQVTKVAELQKGGADFVAPESLRLSGWRLAHLSTLALSRPRTSRPPPHKEHPDVCPCGSNVLRTNFFQPAFDNGGPAVFTFYQHSARGAHLLA
jgi:hypothetical protein